MAEQLARLDAVIDARFKTSHNNKNKQTHDMNPYNQGGFRPTDMQISLLDYLYVPRKCSVQYDRNYHGGHGGYRNNYTQYDRKNHNNTNGNHYKPKTKELLSLGTVQNSIQCMQPLSKCNFSDAIFLWTLQLSDLQAKPAGVCWNITMEPHLVL